MSGYMLDKVRAVKAQYEAPGKHLTNVDLKLRMEDDIAREFDRIISLAQIVGVRPEAMVTDLLVYGVMFLEQRGGLPDKTSDTVFDAAISSADPEGLAAYMKTIASILIMRGGTSA